MPSVSDVPEFIFEEKFPEIEEYKEISEYYDEKYFSCEDGGDKGAGSIYFSFARLTSALAFFYEKASAESIEEAIYESIISTGNPEYTVKNVEDNLYKFIS